MDQELTVVEKYFDVSVTPSETENPSDAIDKLVDYINIGMLNPHP